MDFGLACLRSADAGFWQDDAQKDASVSPRVEFSVVRRHICAICAMSVCERKAAGVVRIERLRRRADFLAAAKSFYKVTEGLTLQIRDRGESDAACRYGLTASRKVGSAPQRNRARRRLRSLALEMLSRHGKNGQDYVFIARPLTRSRPWKALQDDLRQALQSIERYRDVFSRSQPRGRLRRQSGRKTRKTDPQTALSAVSTHEGRGSKE